MLFAFDNTRWNVKLEQSFVYLPIHEWCYKNLLSDDYSNKNMKSLSSVLEKHLMIEIMHISSIWWKILQHLYHLKETLFLVSFTCRMWAWCGNYRLVRGILAICVNLQLLGLVLYTIWILLNVSLACIIARMSLHHGHCTLRRCGNKIIWAKKE